MKESNYVNIVLFHWVHNKQEIKINQVDLVFHSLIKQQRVGSFKKCQKEELVQKEIDKVIEAIKS